MMVTTDTASSMEYSPSTNNYAQQYNTTPPPFVYSTEAGPAVFYTTAAAAAAAPSPFIHHHHQSGPSVQWIPSGSPQYGYPTCADGYTASSPSTTASVPRSLPLFNDASSNLVECSGQVKPLPLAAPALQWYQVAQDRGVFQQQQAIYRPEYYYYPHVAAAGYYHQPVMSIPPHQTFLPSAAAPVVDFKPGMPQQQNIIEAERSASATSSSRTSDAPAPAQKVVSAECAIPPPRNPHQSYAEAMSACGMRDMTPTILGPQSMSAMPISQIPPAAMRSDGSYMGDAKSMTQEMQPGMAYPQGNYLHYAAAAAAAKCYGVVDTRSAEKPSSGNKKKRKDPNAPKNPLSAYLFFVTEQRSQLAQQTHSGSKPVEGSNSPGSPSSFSEVAKELGQRWKSMSEEQRRPYTEMAKKDKERYEVEKQAFGRKKVFIS